MSDNILSNKKLSDDLFELGGLKPKSYWLAYLLFFTLGWAGGHRFYVGKWTIGFIYIAVLYLFNYAVVMLMVIDLFLLFFIVKETHTKKIEDPLYIFFKILFFTQKQGDDIAPWAEKHRSLLGKFVESIDDLARILFLLLAPTWVLLFSLYATDSFEIAALMIFILLFTSYIGSMGYLLNTMQKASVQFPSLARIPLLMDVVDTVRQLHDYYYTHKPNSVFYYIFYPITIWFTLLSSKSKAARHEFKLYISIIVLIFITLVIDSMLSYSSTYPPYLTIGDAISNMIGIILFSLFTFIVALMPTVTTCFKFRFSGNRRGLAVITTLCLFFLVGFYYQYDHSKFVPITASKAIKTKLSKEDFREDLRLKTEMFLTFYYKKVQDIDSDKVEFHPELTDLYRQQLLAITSNDELKTINIITIPDSNTKNVWLGVHYANAQVGEMLPPILPLYLIDPTGTIYDSWNVLPDSIKNRFTLVPMQNDNINEKTYMPNMVSQFGLINELIN